MILAKFFGLLLERDDGGGGVAGLEALLVFVYFPADDGFGGGGFATAIGEVGGGDLLEVVDVVDEAAFDLVHARVDVAGDGDVNEKHRTVAASVEEVLAVSAVEDLLRGSCRGDNDIGAGGLGVEVVEGDRLGADCGAGELGGDLLRAGGRAVGDKDGRGTVVDEVASGELGHFASAYEKDGLAFERAEDFAGEIGGDGGYGDRA